MPYLGRLTRSLRSLVLPIAFVLSVAGLPPAVTLAATTATASSTQTSCSGNSVIPGGVSSAADLKQKYQTNYCGIQPLYNYFGITGAGDFDGMVAGHVDTANNVYVDSSNNTVHTLVGKDAITAGRDNISNDSGTSTPILGGTFYKRPPAVSFASGTLDALIKLDGNGKFLFAVITSCGNPVMATNVVQPKPAPPAPAPTPPAPAAPAQPPAPPATPARAVAPAPQPAQLPATGAAGVLGLFVVATCLGTLVHHLYLRRLAK